MSDWSEFLRSRQSRNIHNHTRIVHRVAKRVDPDTGEVHTGFVTEEVQTTLHDVYRRKPKQNFWRGAAI